ncbi:MAG: glucosaminidase domain-containing protein, partial [Bacteroides sp.]|nr:glucosaminidase domain-containing protein [Bacteroides sp.]
MQFPLHNALLGQSKKSMSREDYISTYSDLAMKEMARVGIPASITLAQGCLESGNGNSTLATKGNNHFGIKCHDWTGKKIYHDDDAKHECFRSYDSPYESYMDHSQFLTTRGRYAGLFELKPHDYRGWAKGLKSAGYATARNYATLLIKIIEDNELYRFDVLVLEGAVASEGESESDSDTDKPAHGYNTTRDVGVNNKVEYIVVEAGDTPESIRKEMDLYAREIYRYNDLYKGEPLTPGQLIYLQPKRKKAAKGNDIHIVKTGETMYDISQIYAVKLDNLYRLNLMNEGAQPLEGTEINLRRKKRQKVLKLQPLEEDA